MRTAITQQQHTSSDDKLFSCVMSLHLQCPFLQTVLYAYTSLGRASGVNCSWYSSNDMAYTDTAKTKGWWVE
jgi:hypothetical protein